MRKIIYSKYNQGRSPRFQTKTIICQDGGKLYIEKSALLPEAKRHIDLFRENFDRVRGIYPKITLVEPEFFEDFVRYPYIRGTGLEESLKQKCATWEAMFEEMKTVFDTLYEVNPENRCGFTPCGEFTEMFGEADCFGMDCISPCNLDVIFDNLVILPDGQIQAFDYEWVCNFAVPERYVIYRILCHFYDKHLAELSVQYDFADYIAKFAFTERELSVFRKMEDAFIRYAYTGGEPAFTGAQYQKHRTAFAELNDYPVLKQEYTSVLDLLHSTEKEYLATIGRLNEAVRIKEEAEEQLHNTEREYLATIDKLNEAVRIKDEMYEQLVRANEACGQMRAALEQTGAAYRQTQEEYTHLLNSSSWKVTKPLRKVKGVLKGRKN